MKDALMSSLPLWAPGALSHWGPSQGLCEAHLRIDAASGHRLPSLIG